MFIYVDHSKGRGVVMRKVGVFEAKQKLSELVERASRGERIGITRRGKLAAQIVPAQEQVDLKKAFEEIEKIRKRSKKVPGVTVKSLIAEGRM
jgi:prevent-host-death family protein